jgi:hypothetical protein
MTTEEIQQLEVDALELLIKERDEEIMTLEDCIDTLQVDLREANLLRLTESNEQTVRLAELAKRINVVLGDY